MSIDSPELGEVLITSDSDANLWSIAVWNPWSGSTLATYKGFSVGAHRLLVVNGTFIAVASFEKPLLDVWYLQHRSTERRTIVTPGLVKALAASGDGVFLAAAIDEQIAVWDVSSGELLALLRRHYLAVNVIRFSDDSGALISGGADGLVLAWDLPSSLSSTISFHHGDGLNDSKQQQQQQSLLHTWSGHSLAVTDLHVGSGAFSLARVASASADHTVRLWDLGTGDCLYTFLFDHVVTSVVMDACEYHLYAGCGNGDVVQVALFDVSTVAPPGTGNTLEAKTSSSSSSSSPSSSSLRVKPLTHHKSRISSLSISFDGSALASASDDGDACVWDLRSRQVIRTLAHKSGVTNVAFAFAPHLQTEENNASSAYVMTHAKVPIWPQLQKRLKEHDNSAFSESKEIFHDVVVK